MLTIAHLQANYSAPQGTPNAAALQARLDRLVRDRLPAELAGRLQPPASDTDAVYRIRRLELDLWLDAAMSEAEIAQAWGQAMLRAVTSALVYGTPDTVMRYDDPAHLLAAFLADLVAGRAWTRWTYAEFAPLRDVSPGQAAALLLGGRPALLSPVARRLAGEGQLEALLRTMHAADVALLWERGLGFANLPAVPALTPNWERLQAVLSTGIPLERGADSDALARNTLRVYLAVIAAEQALAGDVTVAATAYHIALLHAAWSALPAPPLWQALTAGEVEDPASLAPVLTRLDGTLPRAATWLAETLSTPAGRAHLSRLAPLALPEVKSEAEPGRSAQPRVSVAATAFAGLALLAPVLRDLGCAEQLDRAGRYQLLLAAVGRDYGPLALGDPAAAWLAGVPLTEAERAREEMVQWPDVAAWTREADRAWFDAGIASFAGARPEAELALLLLRRLAGRLRGFTESSANYLAQQFIRLPGHLRLADDALRVDLSRAPLGIVLQMAGLDGDRGPLPWLNNRRLEISLPAG